MSRISDNILDILDLKNERGKKDGDKIVTCPNCGKDITREVEYYEIALFSGADARAGDPPYDTVCRVHEDCLEEILRDVVN